MRSPFTKLSIAATVVVACVIGWFVWPSLESVALAEVLTAMGQARAFLYQSRTTTQNASGGHSIEEATILVSSEYGMRVDETTVDAESNAQSHTRTYFLPPEQRVVILDLDGREYNQLTLDKATLETAQVDNRDPREVIERLVAGDHRDLGHDVIDGHQVQGFETTDSRYLMGATGSVLVRVWIDVETRLPVRTETDMQFSDGAHMTAVESGYQWDVTVDASEFKPQIPEGFMAGFANGIRMPSFSEQGFIEALQLAVEFTGHYPKGLDLDANRELCAEILGIIRDGDSPAAREYREQVKRTGSKEAAIRYGQQRMMKLSSWTMFNSVLAGQGKDPVYHGDVVTPKDIELPLMRWKLSDTEYRVIFGDLHAETVSAQRLAALEENLPK